MSYTETHIGTLKEVKNQPDSFEEKIKIIPDYKEKIENYEIDIDDKYICYSTGYVYLNKKLYEIQDKKLQDEDISEATKNDDKIEYIVQYYNGGCGLEEALEDVLKKV